MKDEDEESEKEEKYPYRYILQRVGVTKKRRSTVLNYIQLGVRRSLGLWNCKIFGRVELEKQKELPFYSPFRCLWAGIGRKFCGCTQASFLRERTLQFTSLSFSLSSLSTTEKFTGPYSIGESSLASKFISLVVGSQKGMRNKIKTTDHNGLFLSFDLWKHQQ